MNFSDDSSQDDIRDAQVWGVQSRHRAWINDFVARNGRSPRVLGIGNIANNGYRNAIALREYGVECDVLCYNYFHIMGCPEWEAAEFDTTGLDDFKPVWSNVDLHGYERPRWFAQGTHGTAFDYLIAYRERLPEAEMLWQKLAYERDTFNLDTGSQLFATSLTQRDVDESIFSLVELFELRKHGRNDNITYEEVAESLSFLLGERGRLQRLFRNYDVIIGYATDGIFPVVAGKRPFVAYEHGTIRSIPFEPTTQGRLCNLVYGEADRVLITNCDNIIAAERLELEQFSFTPHAILEEWRHQSQRDVSQALQIRLQFDTDFLVFHPARQHWSAERDPNYDKGNDILVQGFAKFLVSRPRAKLLMVEWGIHVNKTKALIEDLGISRSVAWIRPRPVRGMCRYIAASDVLADQFTIGAFGGIMPIGLMLGKPTLIYLNEDMHRWCFPEMPPVLNASTADGVAIRLADVLDPTVARILSMRGEEWYRRYHSLDVVAGRILDSCIASLGPHESSGASRHPISEARINVSKIRRLEAVVSVKDTRVLQISEHVALIEKRLSDAELQLARLRRAVGPLMPVVRFMFRAVRASRRLCSGPRGWFGG